MKTLLKLSVLAIAFSGMVACSSAPKEQDTITTSDMAEAEISTEENFQPIEPEPMEDTMDESSLGVGSSGLGH